MMEDFYAPQSGASPFAFEQMRHELAELQSVHNAAPQQWSQEFAAPSQGLMGPEDTARMEAAFRAGNSSEFSTAEFAGFDNADPTATAADGHMASPVVGMQQSAYYRQFQGYQFNGGMPFSAAARPYIAQQQHPVALDKGKQVMELSDENWEAQFKEMETLHQDAALDEQANKAIEAELNGIETMHGDFQEIWEGIQREARERADLETLDWDNEVNGDNWTMDNSLTKTIPGIGEYLFEPDNPYLAHQDPYAEGKRLVETGGNLSLAALAFEAAVQQNDRHIEAWTDLGACQAMNEKETPAIRAYEAALKVDQDHLGALMGLAISYTNEGYDTQAYTSLENWLQRKYPSVMQMAPAAPPAILDRKAIHERITSLFIEAAMLVPEGQAMDADVQVGLGVLFYSDEEYEKAIDCFSAALTSPSTSSSPEHLLWNRLGATLANSGRSEEAINAYERALNINPNFVRARYNLGVSCINIGCFQQAAEHLLGALAMHKVAEEKAREDARMAGVEPERIIHNQSTNLFDTLRRVFGQMGRRDLADLVVNGMELDIFRYVFF
jgi:peroxin-5